MQIELTTSANGHTNGNGRQKRTARQYYADTHENEPAFKLDDSFIKSYVNQKPAFGYNGLGEFVFFRTYSRLKENNTKESALDVFRRSVEGTYEIQRLHCRKIHVSWDLHKARDSAHEMFERMWQFKFLPPGRGLWCMGTPFIWRQGSAALQNCGFVSTIDMDSDPVEPFCFLMDMSMLGVGVGFDTKGKDKTTVLRPNRAKFTKFVIPDSREGWVESVRLLLLAYLYDPDIGIIDYDPSNIRPAGTPIKGFGGVASGAKVLLGLHARLREFFSSRIGHTLSSRDITDIMNIIGAAVVAGNVRRVAEVAFGDEDDFSYTTMKNPVVGLTPDETAAFWTISGFLYKMGRQTVTIDDFMSTHANLVLMASKSLSVDKDWLNNNLDLLNKAMTTTLTRDRMRPAVETWNYLNQHRWASNNSVFATVGMDYTRPAQSTAINGEPGYVWLDNLRDYGRMIDGMKPGIDGRVMGTNPCIEQSLESFELCTLSETFPTKHDNHMDYMRTLKFAYLYAKTVTLLSTHNPRTNAVMLRNRRIGLSQTGIVQAFEQFGRRNVLRDFCDSGYHEVNRWDRVYSEWLCVPQSIKKTSVKPSGTISLVVGVPPGIHYPEARWYWRRVRVSRDSIMVDILRDAGYHIEPAISDPAGTVVVKFAVDESNVRPTSEVSVWEQVQNVVDYQRYWTDNQPSCTVKFKRSEADQIKHILECYEDQLKAISFLPIDDHGYPQAPYEACTKEEMEAYNAKLTSIDFSRWIGEDAVSDDTKYCDSQSCVWVPPTTK